jgi:hypothetical protein
MSDALSSDTPSLWETSEVTRAANAVGQLRKCQMSHRIRQQADSHRSGGPEVLIVPMLRVGTIKQFGPQAGPISATAIIECSLQP